jgi:septum formation protein
VKLILGSSSRFRRKILEDAGIPFEVVTPDIDEKKIRSTTSELIPAILSYAKAQAVLRRVTEPAIIIACDQVILCNGEILEKPESGEEVRRWYAMYPKYPVHYVNGFTVINTETKASITAQEIAVATFKEIPKEFMEEQIQKVVIFQCAGGIGDETEDAYATLVEGSKESQVGMPVKFVMDLVDRVK